MFKKASIAILTTLLAFVTVTGIASAQVKTDGEKAGHDGPRHRLMIGQITTLGSDSITFETPKGETHTINVDGETVFKERSAGEATEISFDDLAVGDWIGVHAREDLAKLVVLLPEDFDPESLKGRKSAGEIQMVSQGADFFKLETLDGETLTIQVDEYTHYTGGIDSFDDLEKELKVGVLVLEQSDGSLLAKAVATRRADRPRLDRTGGKIDTVDEGLITITNREGESREFSLSEKTRILSRDKGINGLEDLDTGMPVVVLSNPETDPEAAVAVMIMDEAILSLERAGGRITAIDTDTLTIERDGVSTTFNLTAETRIRGRDINSLTDLSIDQPVGVLYRTEADGSLTAVVIGAVMPPGPGH
jgi:hypothetical protein